MKTVEEHIPGSDRKRKSIYEDVDCHHVVDGLPKREKLSTSSERSNPVNEGLQQAPLHYDDCNTGTHNCAVLFSTPNYEMSWQGDLWTVSDLLGEDSPAVISTPVPVRFLASLTATDDLRDGTEDAPVWTLGLAIHSYVCNTSFELMYVVLLENGREVHLPSTQAECITMVRRCKSTDVSTPDQQYSDFRVLGGHPSSQEPLENSMSSFGSFYSTLVRSSAAISSPACADDGDSREVVHKHEACIEHNLTHTTFVDVLPLYTEVRAEVVLPQAKKATAASTSSEAGARQHTCKNGADEVDGTPYSQLYRQVARSTGIAFPPATTTAAATASLHKQAGPSTSRSHHSELHEKVKRQSGQFFSSTAGLPNQIFPVTTAAIASTSMRQDQFPSSSNMGPSPVSGSSALPRSTPVVDGGPPVAVRRVPRPRAPRRARTGTLSATAQRLAFLEAFSEEKWTTEYSTFAAPALRFSGPTGGPSFPFHRMPTASSLLGRFWSERTLQRICDDTNRYADEVHIDSRLPLGGPNWWRLDTVELKAFFAVNLLMGIKQLSNHRSYWNKGNEFLYCPSISTIMTSKRYEDITRCLHVANDTVPVVPGEDAEFDKLRKMRWLLTELQERFKFNWNLNQEVTVDESMIAYKGKYCPVKQYLPRKPTKWGLKVWALADARQKYIYNFQIYTGSLFKETLAGGGRGDAKNPHDVVMQLMQDLHGRAHIVCTDNLFTSIKLLMELRLNGTYGVGTVKSNRLGLPKALLDLKALSKEPQGTVLWRMHSSRDIAAVVFVDRKVVLLLSTIYRPVPSPGERWPTVPRRIDDEVTALRTSPIHKGYTEFMRGVDVADQLRGNYSCQTRSHKWWHKVFFYLLDTSAVNCYILHKLAAEQLGKADVTHLQFQLQMADELSRPWSHQRGAVSQFRLSDPGVHGLVRSAQRRKCRFCNGRRRTNMVCPQCGGVHLHAGQCFQRSHYVLRR